ncbi:hypothetical protein MNBD_ALPHA11-2009 [hydrothermal vent metagenome]|uniref:Uncharacterized protein n=1 Tax=hydrothermal vent metagenome TaxID=652676 RepID=A0A3B0U105_9ZZZZ
MRPFRSVFETMISRSSKNLSTFVTLECVDMYPFPVEQF